MSDKKKRESVDEVSAEKPPKTTAELLTEIEERRKALRERLAHEKAAEIQERKEAKLKMKELVMQQDAAIRQIQKAIYDYKKLCKSDRSSSTILGDISEIITAFFEGK